MDVTAIEVLAYSVLIAIGVVQSFEDIDTRRVHVLTTRIAGVWVVGMLWTAAILDGDLGAAIRMMFCGLALGGVFSVLDRLTRGGIGRGDLRLTPLIGAATGYLSVDSFALGLLAIAVSGFVLALIELVRVGQQARVPLVPALYIGVLASVIGYG